MSVVKNEYVMIGHKIDLEKFNYEGDDMPGLDFAREVGDEGFVFEGMSGEFLIYGLLINKGDEFEGMPVKSFSMFDHRLSSDYSKKLAEAGIPANAISEPSIISTSLFC